MHELDGVLETDDIEAARRVEVIDHRGQRRRLARARRACDEHHALMQIAKFADDRRQTESLHARNIAGDAAERCANTSFLAIDVDAESPAVGADVGKVEILTVLKTLLLSVGQYLLDVVLELGATEIAKLDRHEIAVQAQHWRNPDRKMHIGATLCQPELEECVNSCHDGFPLAQRCHEGFEHALEGIHRLVTLELIH